MLAGYKRATNIIRIEEKKDGREYTGAPDLSLYKQAEEEALAFEIERAKAGTARAVKHEDFEGAMSYLARLRPYVDAFFDKVTVNVEDKALRENRLKLLNEIRAATRAVADFSKIEGVIHLSPRAGRGRYCVAKIRVRGKALPPISEPCGDAPSSDLSPQTRARAKGAAHGGSEIRESC